jgi:serine/threonine protein kinase
MKSNAYRHSIDSYRLVSIETQTSLHDADYEQMTEVADGLEYLHGQKVVHGDINDVCY